MALERQSIEKKDFPIGRRGYDPEAVDAHLTALADEIDELKRSSRRRAETLASSASDQVRAIVEAAESSAAEIQRQAEEEAQEIRAEAASEAKSTREQATGQARDYVGKVSESTAVMMQRLDAMESELSALIDSLRTGSNRLNADLQLLEGNLTEVTEAATPRPRFEPEPAAESAPEPASYSPPEPVAEVAEPWGARREPVAEAAEPVAEAAEPVAEAAEPVAEAAEPVAEAAEPVAEAAEPVAYGAEPTEQAAEPTGEVTVAPTEAAEQPAEQPSADAEPDSGIHADPGAGAGLAPVPDAGSDDTEGARLIALNMALNGTPREETDRYLAENFQLSDRTGLLDDVYASVEG